MDPSRARTGRIVLVATCLVVARLAPCAYAEAPGDAASDVVVSPALEPCADALPEPAASDEPEPEATSPGIGAIALKDTVYVLGAPLRWSGKQWLAFTGVAAGVVAFGFALDIPARNKTQSHQTGALDELTKVVEPFGQEYSWAVLGAYGIAGFVFRDPNAREIAIDGAMASILASGVITPILKRVIGRARPNQDEGSTAFAPFSSNQSFPSGHATQAFAVASVISAHSDQVWVSIAAYTLAGLVGFARIYHDDHWSSDVAAGAVIGTAVGRSLVAFNKKLRSGESRVRVAFVPVVTGRVRGAGLVIQY